jgi:hypothetical protein
MFNLLSEGILSDSIQRMGKLKSSWTSHAPTAYSICCITSWCQDENHEDCLCPDKNFHSKHLRNLFLIEVFYYLNPLHTAWKTCTQYWTPNLESRNTIPCFFATWGTTKISGFSGCHGLPIFESYSPPINRFRTIHKTWDRSVSDAWCCMFLANRRRLVTKEIHNWHGKRNTTWEYVRISFNSLTWQAQYLVRFRRLWKATLPGAWHTQYF